MEHAKLNNRGRLGKTNSGVALILVLMLVVLATIMILAFFLSVQTESKSVRSVISGQSSRQLADIAVQSVISDIQQATTQGVKVAWASQPGMIRTYDNSGNALKWYKLYSTTNSIVSNPTESPATLQQDVPTQAWATPGTPNYGVFTDINGPVYSADGTTNYPIVNPAGATSTAAATNAILGFDIAAASTPGYSSGSAASPVNNPAAMPVRWIYLLRDGTQVPAASTGTPGTVSVPGASRSNPVVGRIAYWTDDETCKLNVNTAGNGTYFDTPRFQSATGLQNASLSALTPAQRDAQRLVDKQLAISPPVANEYQRYIGHPSQTRLSYAFPGSGSTSTTMGAQDLGTLSQIFSQVNPFMQWGGSEAGIWSYIDTPPPLFPPQRQTPYATLDEWMFNTQLNANSPPIRNFNTVSTVIPPDPTATPIVTSTSLQQLRFFLSANSDAPEVNLFGQPRIAIWPINNDFNWVTKPNSPYVTTTDKVIANAATLFPTTSGTSTSIPYYFTRSNSTSSTSDYSNIPRNINIYQYLENLAGTDVPCYGGKFDGKYSTPEMDQILTEIFDYIRCTDPSDTLLLGGAAGSATDYQYALQTPRQVHGQNGSNPEYAGAGQVTPITIKPSGASYTTKGFGRFYSISEISMDFTRDVPDLLPPVPPITLPTVVDTSNNIVTGVMYLNLFCPSLGPPDLIPHMRVQIDGLNTWTVTTSPAAILATPQNVFAPVTSAPTQSGDQARQVYSIVNEGLGNGNAADAWHDGGWYDFIWGGSAGPRQLTVNKHSSYSFATVGANPVLPPTNIPPTNPPWPPLTSPANNPNNIVDSGTSTVTLPSTCFSANQANYMFAGIPLKLPVGSTINCSGGQLTITISYGDWSNTSKDPAYWSPGDGFPAPFPSDVVQTIKVNFPPFSVPSPTNSTSKDIGSRLYGSNYGPGDTDNSPILSGDSVRSLVSGYNGDSRLVAAQTNVTGTSTATTASTVAVDTMTQPFVFLPPTTATTTTMHTQRDIFANGNFELHGFSTPGSLLSAVNYGSSHSVNGYIGDHTSTGTVATSPDANGDWENGLGVFPDGPYINKPDEAEYQYAWWSGNPPIPYYTGGDSSGATSIAAGTALSYISPNRAVASPVVFGSLSTGVPIPNAVPAVPPVPWRTLLFRPQPTHFGATSPEDHLLLDWFWMPVAEPYAISTTLATAGKVNMNYQIWPFTYITRATALMGVLGSEYVITVPVTSGTKYKNTTSPTNPITPYRQPIRLVGSDGRTIDYNTGTLGQFNQRFGQGKIFKSAGEICDINLVPNPSPASASGPFDPTSASAVASYWTTNALTGDNSRERPYNGLYPRLTTKSNTYTVHVRAQTLAWPVNGTTGQWVENPQLVQSEYRGSVTINRYLDPEDPNIPDFTAPGNLLKYSLDNYYKYRVLETRRFLP